MHAMSSPLIFVPSETLLLAFPLPSRASLHLSSALLPAEVSLGQAGRVGADCCTTHPSLTDTGRFNLRLAAQINANTVDIAVASPSPIVDLVKLITLHTDLNLRCVGTVADLLDCAKPFGTASVAFVRAHMRMLTQVDTEDNDDEGLAALVAANYAGAFLDDDDDSWPIPVEPSTLHPNSESWDSAVGFFPLFPAAAYETGMQFVYVDILGRRAAVSEPSMWLF